MTQRRSGRCLRAGCPGEALPSLARVLLADGNLVRRHHRFGWLLGAFFGAQLAGPAALISWVIAAVAIALVSLVLVELAASRPEVGGSVRWPLYANGRIVGTTFGWTVVLGLLTDTEVLAVTTYLSHYWTWLYDGSSLSAAGIGIAAALEAVLVLLNWYGVRLFARVNLAVT
jgi:amino acid transporter